MQLSIVIPVYNGQDNILNVYSFTKEILKNNFYYEIIFVNDGSTDKTQDILSEISKKDKNIKVINLSKNQGQHKALVEGFKIAKGDIIISNDCDLECSPEYIPQLVNEIKEGYDIVCCVREKRETTFPRKILSYLFNKFFSFLTGIKLYDIGCPLKAYKKEVIKNIIKAGDIPSSMYLWKNLKIQQVKIHSDIPTKSTYSFFKLLKLSIYTVKKYFYFLLISFFKSK